MIFCIHKTQIPPEYHGLRILGRGMTSIALEKDADTVLMLTRDRMKMEWLRDGAEIGRIVEEHETFGHPVEGMDEIPVYAMELPKLRKLDGETRRSVNRALREFGPVLENAMAEYRYGRRTDMNLVLMRVLHHFLPREDHLLHPLIDWIKNYDGNQFIWDLGPRNFMQDDAGRVVIVDPIASTELMDLVERHRLGREPSDGRFCGGPAAAFRPRAW